MFTGFVTTLPYTWEKHDELEDDEFGKSTAESCSLVKRLNEVSALSCVMSR
jgi:hypothetical protein